MIPIDCFEGQSSDGRIVPIVPGGRSIPLTYANRKQYVERAIAFRLHEMDAQVLYSQLISLPKFVHMPKNYQYALLKKITFNIASV